MKYTGKYFTGEFPARETVAVKALPKNVNVEIIYDCNAIIESMEVWKYGSLEVIMTNT